MLFISNVDAFYLELSFCILGRGYVVPLQYAYEMNLSFHIPFHITFIKFIGQKF